MTFEQMNIKLNEVQSAGTHTERALCCRTLLESNPALFDSLTQKYFG